MTLGPALKLSKDNEIVRAFSAVGAATGLPLLGLALTAVKNTKALW
eukprot:gene10120-16825_t